MMVPEALTRGQESEARQAYIKEEIVAFSNQGWVLQETVRKRGEYALQSPCWSQEELGYLLRLLSLIGWELSYWAWIPWLLQTPLNPEKALRHNSRESKTGNDPSELQVNSKVGYRDWHRASIATCSLICHCRWSREYTLRNIFFNLRAT